MATTKKVQIGVLISLIGLILMLATNLVAYGRSDGEQKRDIKTLQREMDNYKPKIDKVNVIENDIEHIKSDVSEIKNDVKTLLQRK